MQEKNGATKAGSGFAGPGSALASDSGRDGLATFHPVVAQWFRTRIGIPSAPQREAWPKIEAGSSVLVTAPTGAGKTLAAFLVALDELLKAGLDGAMPGGVHVLYVSPLKALNNDINRNLEMPLSGIRDLCAEQGIPFPEIRKAVRTGDTSSSERQAMLRQPPHILITTPESLFLLLTSTKASGLLTGVKYLIVDEIHAVLGTKRGAHLSLSIERLAAITAPGLVRVGLSATVRPLELAARFLGGYDRQGTPNPVALVAPPLQKMKDLRIEMPVSDFRTLEAGSVWPDIYDTVLRLIRAHTATLVFVNNRATAERIAANVNELAAEELCVPHHGSLSRERRQLIESRFKTGNLRCMVATATLELGIDIGQVDLMIQISAPVTIAGGLQRLGRAGHRMDAVSRGRVIPKTRGDLLKSLFVAREMEAGRIEAIRLPREPLDVLAQQLVSMSCIRRWTEEELLAVVRGSASYRELRLSDLHRVLAMLAGEYEHREDIPAKPRLFWDRIHHTVEGTPYSRMLAVSAGGTIPDRGLFPVVLADGHARIGELDEEYVFESRQGDVFMLGNTPWRMERIDRDRVVVTPAESTHGAETPFWKGDGLGMPLEQGRRYGSLLGELEQQLLSGTLLTDLLRDGLLEEVGAGNLAQYLADQREATGVLPTDSQIVMETVADADAGVTVILHALFGGRVNATLETLLRNALEETLHLSVYTTHTDEMILLYLYNVQDEDPALLSLLSPEDMERTLLRILPSTSRFSIAFRYNAYRALMMGTRKHGSRLPLWIQRLRSVEALEQAVRSADHPLLVETMRECMEEAFDVRGTQQVLKALRDGRISVLPVRSWYPSPFAAEVMMRFESELLYASAAPHPGGIRRPVVSGMEVLHLEQDTEPESLMPDLDPEAVRTVVAQNLPLTRFLGARSRQEVHSLLLVHGDLPMSVDPESVGSPEAHQLQAWLKELLEEGRACRTGQPVCRWIAREEAALYATAEPEAWRPEEGCAMTEEEEGQWTREEAVSRILRRFARYAGPFTEQDVVRRYCLKLPQLLQALQQLEEEHFLLKTRFPETEEPSTESRWCHRILWERMRRQGLKNRAARVQGTPAAAYAAWLPGHQRISPVVPLNRPSGSLPEAESVRPGPRGPAGTQSEQLLGVLGQFSGMPLPAAWWEEILFPARLPGYHPGWLDKLCGSGRIRWRMQPGADEKNLLLVFMDPETEAMGVERPLPQVSELPVPDTLPPEARRVLDVLDARGACFTHQLTGTTGLPVTVVMQALNRLVCLGLVSNDTYAPVRLFLEWNKARDPAAYAKRLAMMTARKEMGRWERVSPPEPRPEQQLVEAWFSRWGIVCREVAEAEGTLSWAEAYERMKHWEFAGKAQRGLFHEGFSGIQFVRTGMPPTAPPSPCWHVLSACDPALAYGRVLPHAACTLDFSRLPGTVVVLRDGDPVLALERNGTGLRATVAGEAFGTALRCLAQAFGEKRIWPSERCLSIRPDAARLEQGPQAAALRVCLEALGFEAEPGRMVLRRHAHL